MRCPNCQHKIDKKIKYCPECDCKIKQEDTSRKRNSKKILIAITSVFLIILVGVSGWLIYYFTYQSNDVTTEATTTITRFFDAYCSKDGDANNYLTLTSIDNAPISYEGYQGYCAEKTSYKIIDLVKNDSDMATATVEIKNIDLNSILNDLDKKTFNEDDEVIEYFYSLIQSADVPTRSYTCDVICKQYPTGMKILFNAELSNALLGGFSAYIVGNHE